MTRLRVLGLAVLALGIAAFAAVSPAGSDDGAGPHIAIEDDCDPNDPAWNVRGGCTQKRGDVTFLEFAAVDLPAARCSVDRRARPSGVAGTIRRI